MDGKRSCHALLIKTKAAFYFCCYLLPHSAVAQRRPELSQPRVRLLRDILVGNLSLEFCNAIARQVVQRVLLIRSSANSVRHRLYIVADLLVDIAGHVQDLRILDAVFVAVIWADLLIC